MNDSKPKKPRRLKLNEMEETARLATRTALENYESIRDLGVSLEHLTRGVIFDDDQATYELYFSEERPEDARVLTQATIDRYTGELLKMEVFLEPKKPKESVDERSF